MLCNYMYETCTTVPTFCTGYTYVAIYVCRALYDNPQIQLQLQEYCLPLRRACMQCAHYEKRDSC